MSVNAADKKNVMKAYSRHDKDTGSPEVQIAVLSQRIVHLTEHFGKFKKDNNSKRGLVRLIGRRRRLMNYLKKTNPEGYNELVKKMEAK